MATSRPKVTSSNVAPMALGVIFLVLCLHVPTAVLLTVPAQHALLRAPASPLVTRLAAPPLLCAAEEEPPAVAEPAEAEEAEEAEEAAVEEAAEDPKAAAKAALKAEKAALRDAIADIEARLPKARGELVSALDAAKDAGENGYMLLAANFERFRQQAKTELGTQKGYGKIATVRALLPFAEAFEVLQADDAAADGEEGAAIHKYYGGIYNQTQQLLDSWQLTTFDAAPNDKFDVRIHQTVESIVSDDVAAGLVIAGVERGWKMGDEVVRLAKCKVSSGPAVEEPAEAAADGDEAPADEAEEAAEAAEGAEEAAGPE